MGLVNSKEMICPVEMQCTEWARKHMGYCLCSTNDWLSLILGLLSVMTWSVAEIPQIITNYRQKSAEGLSISFLMTWLVGWIRGLRMFLFVGIVPFWLFAFMLTNCFLISCFCRDFFNLVGCMLEAATVSCLLLTLVLWLCLISIRGLL